MQRFLILLTLILLSACGRREPMPEVAIPQPNEINELMRAVIEQDSLSLRGISMNPNLIKLKTHFIKQNKGQTPLRPDRGIFYISTKLPTRNANNKTFVKHDSLYLLIQNDTLKTFRLDKSFCKLIRLTGVPDIKKGNLTPKFVANCHYEMSIPIFSVNHNFAYVQLIEACNFFSGGAVGIYLKKISGKWTIVKEYTLWDV